MATTNRTTAKRASRRVIGKAAKVGKKGAARAIDAAGRAARAAGKGLTRAGKAAKTGGRKLQRAGR